MWTSVKYGRVEPDGTRMGSRLTCFAGDGESPEYGAPEILLLLWGWVSEGK